MGRPAAPDEHVDSLGRREAGDARTLRGLFRFVVVLVPLGFLISGGMNIGPSIDAATGHGTRGTFTVTDRQCEKDDCTWKGTFQPADPSIAAWTGTQIYGGHVSGIGASTAAIDTDDYTDVYPIGGGAWRSTAGEMATSCVLLALGVWAAFVRPLRRKRRLESERDREPGIELDGQAADAP